MNRHERTSLNGQMPLFVPGSSWTPPAQLPSLAGVKRIGFDLETRDPDLDAKGIGVRRDGKIVGLAVGIDDGPRFYLPVGHEGPGNLDKAKVMAWAKSELNAFTGEVVGAYLGYDLDYIAEWGVTFPNVTAFHDVAVAEALIDEWRDSYSLDAIALAHVGEGKDETLLREASVAFGFGKDPKAVKRNLWRLPANLVGPYAEADVDRPLRTFPVQEKIMRAEDTWGLYDKVERHLVPLLVHMRRRGVRIDVTAAAKLRAVLSGKLSEIIRHLKLLAGPAAELTLPDTLGPALRARGLDVPLTAKTNVDSVTKPWLERNAGDELVDVIAEGRKIRTLIDTFIDSQILGSTIKGRIHPTFNQIKGEDGGTIARFCLSGGTEVMLPGGVKLIENVCKGDEVYCYDDKRRLTISKVKWAGKTGSRKVMRITFSKNNGGKKNVKCTTQLVMTYQHLVRLTDGSYKRAIDLKLGDHVMALARSGMKNDYKFLCITGTGGRAKAEHRLVYAIKNNCSPECVHHLDEDRENNRSNNLEGKSKSHHQSDHLANGEAARRALLGHIRTSGHPVKAMNDARTFYSKLRSPPDEMLKRWDAGQSITKIAREMSAAKPTVRKRLIELGVVFNNHKIIKIEFLTHPRQVYDIEVEEHHNFIANEICVHNSGSNPNMQFIPARDGELAPLIRGLFLPDEGDEWQQDDLSQIQFRMLTDCAVGKGAEESRAQYVADPKTDFHKMTAEMLGADPEDKVRRKRVKNTNFAKVFGAQTAKLAQTFGCSVEEAEEFMRVYEAKLPFVSATFDAASRWGQKRGFVTTVLGRRQRFPFWGPARYRDERPDRLFRSEAEARDHYVVENVPYRGYPVRRVERVNTYTALNRKMQGSEGDLMKKWMVDADAAGVLAVIGPFLATVHDELGSSVPRTKVGDEAGRELVRLGEVAVKLKVPVLVGSARGDDWGHCDDYR